MTPRRGTPTLLDRALVLAVAEAERDGAAWLDKRPETPSPDGGDDEVVLARARRIAANENLEAPVRRAIESQRLLWPGAAVVGLIGGVSAAWAGLAGGGDPTSVRASDLNVLWFLQATLGLHTLFFLASLAAMALALTGGRHPLLRASRAAAAALGRLAGPGRAASAVRSAAAAALSGRRGALLAGALGHTMGLGFIAGCLVALLTAASFREQYRFFWKSTLLTDGQATALIDAIAAGPRAAGFGAPSAEEIAAARAGVNPPADWPIAADTSRWVWLLVGALLVWGVAPRAIALAACLAGASLAGRRAPLPISESYRRRALARMRPPAPLPAGSRDPDALAHDAPPPPTAPDDRPLGPPVLLGYEIDANGAWPPNGLSGYEDLGLIDGASDRRRVLERLDLAPTRPRAVVAFFSRGETPAEAERRFIADLVARAGPRAGVALTLSRALSTEREERDAERIAQRTRLWREAAERAGVEPAMIAEVDLHHLTDATQARLRALLDGKEAAPSTRRTRDIAAALREVEAWAQGGDFSDQSLAALLGRIESRLGAEPRWRKPLRAIATSGDLDAARALVTESARSIARVLPAWLPRHPGWMAGAAALATTGTLAAVALAGGPVGLAAGAWPLYAAAGAAIGEIFGRGAGSLAGERPGDGDACARGARAAVLHALVLALQGVPDAHVADTIDRVLADAPEVRGAPDVPALTAHVRDRLHELHAGEGAP